MSEKLVLGSIESYSMPELGIESIEGISDTGARTSSIHATNTKIVDKNGQEQEYNPKKKQWVTFTTGKEGEEREITTRVVGVRNIITSDGIKHARYLIQTPVQLANGDTWNIELSLNERSNMQTELLLGRRALRKNAIIDPSQNYLADAQPKRKHKGLTIGRNENCSILELGLENVKARVDTGAQTSSLHAVNIEFTKDEEEKEFVSFDTEHDGNRARHTYPLLRMQNIKTPSGEMESRPVIEAEIQIGSEVQTVPLNLNDRLNTDKPGHFSLVYPMLLGRDALEKFDFLVNPEKRYTMGHASKPDWPPISSKVSRYNPTGIALPKDTDFIQKLEKHAAQIELRKLQDKLDNVKRPKILVIMDSHRVIANKELKRLKKEGLSVDEAVLFSTSAQMLALERAGFDVDIAPYGKDKIKLGDKPNELIWKKPDHLITHHHNARPVRGFSGRPQIGYIEQTLDLNEYQGVVSHIATKSAALGLSILERCQENGLEVLNTVEDIQSAKSKVKTQHRFWEHDIDTPETLIIDKQEDLQQVKQMLKDGNSIIIKADAGGAGDAVEKADSYDEAVSIIQSFQNTIPEIKVVETQEPSRHPRRAIFDAEHKDTKVFEGQWQRIANMSPPFKVYVEDSNKSVIAQNANQLKRIVDEFGESDPRVVVEDIPESASLDEPKTKTIKPGLKSGSRTLKGALAGIQCPCYVQYRRPGGRELLQIEAHTKVEAVKAIKELRKLGQAEKPEIDILVQEMLDSTPPRVYKHVFAKDDTSIESFFGEEDEKSFSPPYRIKAQTGEGNLTRYSEEIIAESEEEAIEKANKLLKDGADCIRLMGVNLNEKPKANDRRIIAVRDKEGEYHLLAALDRSASSANEIKANISKGGRGVIRSIIDLTDEEYHLALKTAKASGLGITGVDLMSDPPKALEVNDSMAIGRYGGAVHDKIANLFKGRILDKHPEVKEFFDKHDTPSTNIKRPEILIGVERSQYRAL